MTTPDHIWRRVMTLESELDINGARVWQCNNCRILAFKHFDDEVPDSSLYDDCRYIMVEQVMES